MPFLPLTHPIYPDLGPAPKPAGLQAPVAGLACPQTEIGNYCLSKNVGLTRSKCPIFSAVGYGD